MRLRRRQHWRGRQPRAGNARREPTPDEMWAARAAALADLSVNMADFVTRARLSAPAPRPSEMPVSLMPVEVGVGAQAPTQSLSVVSAPVAFAPVAAPIQPAPAAPQGFLPVRDEAPVAPAHETRLAEEKKLAEAGPGAAESKTPLPADPSRIGVSDQKERNADAQAPPQRSAQLAIEIVAPPEAQRAVESQQAPQTRRNPEPTEAPKPIAAPTPHSAAAQQAPKPALAAATTRPAPAPAGRIRRRRFGRNRRRRQHRLRPRPPRLRKRRPRLRSRRPRLRKRMRRRLGPSNREGQPAPP